MVNIGMQWKLYDGSTGHSSDAISRQALALKEQRDDLNQHDCFAGAPSLAGYSGGAAAY